MKLTYRLTILFFLMAILPTVIVGYVGYNIGKRIILDETKEHLVTMNVFKSRELERWIKNSKSSLEELAQRPLVRQYASVMAASHEMQDASYREAHRNIIENHLTPRLRYGNFRELFVMCSPQGHISASTDNKQDGKYRNNRRYFIEGKSRTYVEGSYYSSSLEQPAMTISMPIKDNDGNTYAVLAGRLNLNELSEVMAQHSGKSRTLDTYLVNSFNFFVSEPRFGKDYILKKVIRTEGINAGLSGKDGFSFNKGYRGVPVIGAYKWLPEFRMCIITEIDQSEAFAPVVQLAWIIASSILVIITIAVFMGMFFARTISLPLTRLAKGAQEIGSGNLEYKVGTASKDEIGELSRAFERMAQELKKTTVSRDAFSRERDFSDSVINSLPGVFYLFDEQGCFLRWNKNFEQVTGYSPEEISKMSPLDLFAGEDRQLIESRIRDVFIKGEETAEAYFVTKSGRRIPYYFTGIQIIIDGKALLVGVGIDMTERKQAEELAGRLEHRYRILFDEAPAMYVITRKQEGAPIIEDCNSLFLSTIGYTHDEVIGRPLADFYTPESRKKLLENGGYLRALSGSFGKEERELVTSDGCVIETLLNAVPEADKDGKVTGTRAMFVDITDRKRAEEKATQIAKEWQSTFDSTKSAIWILDQDQRVVRSNKTAELFFKRQNDELIGKHCWEIVHGTTHSIPECPILRVRKSLSRETMELQIGEIWFEVTVDPILDSAGRYAGAVHSISNITTRKRTEEEIIKLNVELDLRVKDRTAQLEATNKELEAFSYSVSHDLRSPLQHITGFAELLNKRAAGSLDDKNKHYLKVISDSTIRMGRLIDDLLSFSRMGRAEMLKKRTNLDILVAEVLKEFQSGSRGKGIEWKIGRLPEVYGDSAMLRQVFVNLVSNAYKFTEKRKDAVIEIGSSKSEKGDLCVYVKDNGAGFDMKYSDKLFGIFQRLHSANEFEGTGIGLANVRRIIHRHGCKVWAEGKVGEGATFWFTVNSEMT